MNLDLLRAFLDDCKDHPDDDARRLILADWLEENGDTEADRARGEFVRLQVRLAAGLECDPALRPLRERADTLLRTHRATWLGALGQAGGARDRTFTRGLVGLEAATPYLLSARFRTATTEPAWPWVDALRVRKWNRRMGQLLREPCLRYIRRLRLPPYPDGWLDALIASEHLDGLLDFEIGPSHQTQLDAAPLANWPVLARLRRLALSHNGINDNDSVIALMTADLSSLQALEFSGTRLADPGIASVLRCPRLTALTHLKFGYGSNLSGTAFRDHLAGAVFGPTLRQLTLINCLLGANGVRALVGSALPALRHLSLNSCGIPSPFIADLARAPWLPQLESLTVSDRHPPPDLQPLLAAPLRGLRTLTLWCGEFTGPPMAALVSSPHLGELRVLTLDGNNIGGEGARQLARWPGLTGLYELNLRYNWIAATCVQELLDSPYLSPTTQVNLAGNQATRSQKQAVRQAARPIQF
jgi:uncharacterized protein (TIGR02996 family)